MRGLVLGPVAVAAQLALPDAEPERAVPHVPEGARQAFYGDCDVPPVDRLRPMSLAAFGTPVTTPAWRSRPSTYVLCTQDDAIHPDVQAFLAKRCTTTVVLEASHSPMLSQPDRVAEILRATSG